MQCSNCNTEISMVFKHALQKNECPVCGKSLMDEEMLKILDDLKSTIGEEINVKDESVDRLANALLSKYNISFRDNNYVSYKKSESIKVYKTGSISSRGALISADEIMKEDISDEERDRILEEALKSKFQDISMSDGVMVDEYDPDLVGPNIDVDESMISRLAGGSSYTKASSNSPFSEGEINPYAEQKRQESLARQRQNINSGAAKIKRA